MRRVVSRAWMLVALAACSTGMGTDAEPADTSPEVAAEPEIVEGSVIGDGKAVLAAAATGGASLVATTTGAHLIDSAGSTSAIETGIEFPSAQVAISADGAHALLRDLAVAELWRLDPEPTLVDRYDDVTSADFSAGGRAVVATFGSRVDVVAVDGTRRTIMDASPGEEFGAAAMTPDAALVAAPVRGATTDLITYTDADGPVAANVLDDPDRSIVRAEFGGRHDRLVLEIGSEDQFDGQLAAWDPSQSRLVWEAPAGAFTPGAMWAVDSEGRVLTVDGSIARLIGETGTIEHDWELGDDRWATALVATATGFALALSDSSVLLTSGDGEREPVSIDVGRRIVDLRPVAGSDGVVTVDDDGMVRTWSGTGDLLAEVTSFATGTVNDVAVLPDLAIAAATSDGVVTITDAAGATLASLQHGEGSLDALDVTSDGSRVITGVGERLSDSAFDDTVSLWNLDDEVRVARSGGDGEDVAGCGSFRNAVEYAPNDDRFAAISHDFTVSLHDADSGRVVTTLPPHVSTVLDLAFSPVDESLVTASEDGAVRVWDPAAQEILSEFIGPLGGYRSVSFMPDGSGLVVLDSSGALRIVDVADGAERLAFQGSASPTGRPAISPDGSLVVAPVDGNDVGVWSTSTGELLSSAGGHRAPVTSAAFSADGSMLVTGSLDATVRTWRLEADGHS